MRKFHMLVWLAGALLLPGCSDIVDGIFTDADWEEIEKLSPLPEEPPLDPTNMYAADPMAAAFGQQLFFERSYAGPIITGNNGQNGGLGEVGERGRISCRDCHLGPWMIDTRSSPDATSLGADRMARNSASLVNIAYYPYPWFENDGLMDSIWGESVVDLEFDPGFNSSRLRLAHAIYDKYRDEYNRIFQPLDPALDPSSSDAARFPASGRPGSPEWEGMDPDDQDHVNRIQANVGKALHAYQRKLISRNAPFDRYVAGDYDAISESAKRGLKLFISKGACIECHNGPAFTDSDFHNTGMVPRGETALPANTDAEAWPLGGRYSAIDILLGYEFNSKSPYSDDPSDDRLGGLVKRDGDKGKWRTKSLRQVAETAPYTRTGQFRTLQEVVEFYNRGGDTSGFIGTKDEAIRPLDLTDGEIDDLVEFLKTLTGEELAAELLENTSKP